LDTATTSAPRRGEYQGLSSSGYPNAAPRGGAKEHNGYSDGNASSSTLPVTTRYESPEARNQSLSSTVGRPPYIPPYDTSSSLGADASVGTSLDVTMTRSRPPCPIPVPGANGSLDTRARSRTMELPTGTRRRSTLREGSRHDTSLTPEHRKTKVLDGTQTTFSSTFGFSDPDAPQQQFTMPTLSGGLPAPSMPTFSPTHAPLHQNPRPPQIPMTSPNLTSEADRGNFGHHNLQKHDPGAQRRLSYGLSSPSPHNASTSSSHHVPLLQHSSPSLSHQPPLVPPMATAAPTTYKHVTTSSSSLSNVHPPQAAYQQPTTNTSTGWAAPAAAPPMGQQPIPPPPVPEYTHHQTTTTYTIPVPPPTYEVTATPIAQGPQGEPLAAYPVVEGQGYQYLEPMRSNNLGAPMQHQDPNLVYGGTYAVDPAPVMWCVHPPSPGPQPPQPQPQPQPGPRISLDPPEPRVLLEGWLKKRGPKYGMDWKLRHCVLTDDGFLSYWRDKGEDKKGEIEIRPDSQIRQFRDPGATSEARVMAHKYPHGIEIFQGNDVRTWYLDPGTREKQMIWQKILIDCVVNSRNRIPARVSPSHANLLGIR